jgi:hypothetical protein
VRRFLHATDTYNNSSKTTHVLTIELQSSTWMNTKSDPVVVRRRRFVERDLRYSPTRTESPIPNSAQQSTNLDDASDGGVRCDDERSAEHARAKVLMFDVGCSMMSVVDDRVPCV